MSDPAHVPMHVGLRAERDDALAAFHDGVAQACGVHGVVYMAWCAWRGVHACAAIAHGRPSMHTTLRSGSCAHTPDHTYHGSNSASPRTLAHATRAAPVR